MIDPIAADAARVCDDLVLRGGMLTRAWIDPPDDKRII